MTDEIPYPTDQTAAFAQLEATIHETIRDENPTDEEAERVFVALADVVDALAAEADLSIETVCETLGVEALHRRHEREASHAGECP